VTERIALAAALLGALVAAASGPAVRTGLASFTVGILMLPAAGLLGFAAALLALLALWRGGRVGRALTALVVGLAIAAIPAGAYVQARSVPRINDISTDPQEQSEESRRAYPDIQPLRLKVAPNIAFERAKGAIEESGWQLVREDASAGRLEAVATTFWFGFKDDVIVRVAADGGGSRVDVRSKSRVGKGDLGTNAQRIRTYLRRLQ
jgi:uncharacterized protein (DUF1499 family)